MSWTPARRVSLITTPMPTAEPMVDRAMRVATSNTVNLGTNANGRSDDAHHRKGERAPHQARGHQCSLIHNPGTDRAAERRLGAPRMRICEQETLARNVLDLPTEDEQREATTRHEAKCRTPGMRFALRMRGEWNEETRVDTERRGCATRLRDEAEELKEIVGAEPDRAHRAVYAILSRPEMCCAGLTVEECDEVIRICKQASTFIAAAGGSEYRKARLVCRDGMMVQSRSPRGPSKVLRRERTARRHDDRPTPDRTRPTPRLSARTERRTW